MAGLPKVWTPRAIDCWLEQLPSANPLLAINDISDLLEDLPNKIHNVSTRAFLLELISNKIDINYPALLQKLYIPYQSLEHRLNTLNLCQQLQQNLAQNYLAITKELLHKPNNHEKKQLADAIVYSMSALVEMIINASYCYIKPPRSTWLKLHSLFVYAEQHNLLELVLFNKHILQTYKLALLLETASLNKLSPEQMTQVVNILKKHANAATLSHTRSAFASYHINLMCDSGPSHVDMNEIDQFLVDRENRLLLTHAVAAEIQIKQTEYLAQGLTEYSLNQLTHSLMSQWQRSVKRISSKATSTANFGLSNAHQQLSINTTQAGNDDSCFSLLRQQGRHHDNDIWQVVNVSDHGCCLKHDGPLTDTVIPGELVTLAIGENKQRIGIIRWLDQESESKQFIGIEFLSEKTKPISGQLQKADGSTTSNVHGLLIADQPSYLILPNTTAANCIAFTPEHDSQTQAISIKSKTRYSNYQEFIVIKQKGS